MSEHIIKCELPKPKRRLLGLLAACSVCGQLHVCIVVIGSERNWVTWRKVKLLVQEDDQQKLPINWRQEVKVYGG